MHVSLFLCVANACVSVSVSVSMCVCACSVHVSACTVIVHAGPEAAVLCRSTEDIGMGGWTPGSVWNRSGGK